MEGCGRFGQPPGGLNPLGVISAQGQEVKAVLFGIQHIARQGDSAKLLQDHMTETIKCTLALSPINNLNICYPFKTFFFFFTLNM